MKLPLEVEKILSLFTVLLNFHDLFEFPVANMIKVTYENIRNMCSGVISRKQTLQFIAATATMMCLRVSFESMQTWPVSSGI